jgi:alcohol dehydrogenase
MPHCGPRATERRTGSAMSTCKARRHQKCLYHAHSQLPNDVDTLVSARHVSCWRDRQLVNPIASGADHQFLMNTDLSPLTFQHLAPELRLFCGEESLASLARELHRNGCRRAVVISGRSVGSSDAMELLRQALGPVLVGECRAVRSNSPVPAVEEAARSLEGLGADAVIAVGGGSAAVTARAASILLAEKRPAQELCTSRRPNGEFHSPRLDAPKLPQFALPTTPSTVFIKAGSGIHDPDTGRRLALFDPKTRAKAIVIHPAFLRTSPVGLIQSASLNTLCTAVEALESPRCDPISEAMLMHAVRLTARHLPAPEDIPARERLAVAAVLCGRGTEQSGGGLASVLGHAIGHRSHVDNSIVNAIVLPHTMRFNASETQVGAARIAEALHVDPTAPGSLRPEPARTAETLESLFGKLSIPRRLRDIGVDHEDLGAIADAAMSDWFIGRNPRRVSSAGEVLAVLEAAW